MKAKTIYLPLDKLSEDEIKTLPWILTGMKMYDNVEQHLLAGTYPDGHPFFHLTDFGWDLFEVKPKNKTEITFDQFKKLGTEVVNNKEENIKIEHEAIQAAVESCEKFGLIIEVFHSALKLAQASPTMPISEVIFHARCDWDV